VVCGKPEPHVNRTINAFIAGAHDASAKVKVKVTFIDSWYDPPKAKAAALAQITAGADVIYAEREGAIAGAKEKGVFAFGNLVDQFAEAPECVITGPVWNMTPLADYIVKKASLGVVHAEDLQDFSTLARGGATLAPFHGWETKLPPETLEILREKDRALKAGLMTLEQNAATPKGD
jgi:basic membrane lipoprotein Med (substrate-binding protein (PBP1-ABC) superfamily)